MLTADQQAAAVAALEIVPHCLRYFTASYPCLRGVLSPDDMESAANYACVTAARTYDPARGVSAYFSRAIIHELLKACQRELRGKGKLYRVPLEAVEMELPSERLQLEDPAQSTPAPVIQALAGMNDEDRRWIVALTIEGVSVREWSRREKISARQGAKLFRAKLARLAKSVELQRD